MAGVAGRSGKGRGNPDPIVVGFREFCRSVVSDPRVQAKIQETALANPEFALRLAEHGYGRPPQALDVKFGNSNDGPLEFRILDATGADFAFGRHDLPTRSVPLPTAATE